MNNRTIETLMDLRDERIRLGYQVAALEDKAFWEPEDFTKDDEYWLRYYRAEIARIKAVETELRSRMKGV